MKIQDLILEKDGDRTRSVATISWEDCDRPRQRVYFGTDAQFADGLTSNPHAFLLAGIMPAFWHGEERVLVEGEVCPELQAGLMTAMSVIRHWYGLNRKLVRIEAKKPKHIPISRTIERAGFFLTGGIDSLATLRANRLDFPLEHPGYIKDGLLIFGLEVDNPTAFQYVLDSLSMLARETGITLIPVYTNERYLDDDWDFWIDVFEGTVLAAVAHAFSKRLTVVSIASSFDIPNLHAIASHPLLDPNFSSYDLKIRHDGAAFSRLEKTRLLADWQTALQCIRVCNKPEHYRADMLNCGRCEKCIRTMVTLLILDVLDKSHAFPPTNVTERLIRETVHLNRKNFRFWGELIAPLNEKGRDDLARAVKYVLARYYGETGWRGPLKHFDSKYLDGNLVKFKRKILSRLRPIN